jgi:hypothetical protein
LQFVGGEVDEGVFEAKLQHYSDEAHKELERLTIAREKAAVAAFASPRRTPKRDGAQGQGGGKNAAKWRAVRSLAAKQLHGEGGRTPFE